MQFRRILATQVGAIVLATLGAWSMPASAQAPMPGRGDLAPDYVGKTYDGERVLLSAYAGKVVVVSYWATWCGPCRKELPLLEGIQQVAGKERLQVIAVNIEALDTYRRVARRMSSLQMTVAHDSNSEGSKAYGVKGIPHMVIIGKNGRIVRVNRGYSEEGVDRAIADINLALAN